MKRVMTPRAERRERTDVNGQSLRTPFILSLTAHLIFFGVCIGLPHMSFDRRSTSKVINVQLVGMTSPASDPAPSAAPKSKEKTVEKPKAPEPEPEKTPEVKPEAVPVEKPKVQPEEAVSIAPKPVKEKVSLKKKTYDAQKVVKNAVKKVEERVESTREPSNSDQLQQALDRIRQNLKEDETKSSGEGTGTAGSADGEGGVTSEIKQIYYAEVQAIIRKNWAFSEQLAGGRTDLGNTVVIKIMRNGEIKDKWFDRRSGNDYFDESTYKAIEKSNPLPPIPEKISGSYMNLGIEFSPKDLN